MELLVSMVSFAGRDDDDEVACRSLVSSVELPRLHHHMRRLFHITARTDCSLRRSILIEDIF